MMSISLAMRPPVSGMVFDDVNVDIVDRNALLFI